MESKKQQKREAFQDAWRTKRSVTLVYILLRASVILVMLAQIFNRNFENVFLCVLTLFLFMVPSMLERKLDIALPNTLEIIIRRRSWARLAHTTSPSPTGTRCCIR
jgi:magnesium-transporting ATPase (P-type)